MFKKLDILIIRAFIGPFIATFFITLLVLVLQFFWLYIDDFVGKGLEVSIIFEYVWYLSATLVPIALPLAVLLASLMTFGNLGESLELVAIKSSGISLLRFMRPVFLMSLALAAVAFVFSNFVIPVANLKQRTLLSDIVWSKPAFDLKEGVFYERINGFAIKIGKKESNDSVIRDIIIYEQGNSLQDNFIIARSGIMRVSENRRFLELNLYDGWRYQEQGNAYDRDHSDYIRIRFREFKKKFDLSTLGFTNRTADSVNKNNEKMLSMRQLKTALDSLQKDYRLVVNQTLEDIYRLFRFRNYTDSAAFWKSGDAPAKPARFDDLLPDSARNSVNENTRNQARAISLNLESLGYSINFRSKEIRKHRIEWHRKIVLSLACIVLFLIGAPLGAIIRKGGLGTPLLFAIAFFMVFYFSSTTGEKMAKEGKLSVVQGMWLATAVLLPIGIFLTIKALRDSQFLSKEFYYRAARGLKNLFKH